jgi:metal-responsive CopG/Arc/MetJ family transcriptional regulator
MASEAGPPELARRIVQQFAELLRGYGYEERARYVESVAREPMPTDFWHVSGLECWGSAGAVWEVEPFDLSHQHVDQAAEDYRRFRELMLDLEGFVRTRGGSSRAGWIADLFRKQLSEEDS